MLLSLCRFWQIESLYRANAKYQPEWVPPLHLLRILSRPTENRDRGTQGRGLHRHPRMAPADPASLTSSPIDRTARSTAELDGRNTEDRTLALSGPRQRSAFSIHAPAVRIHRLVAELNPHGSEPGSDIPGSLFVPEIMIRRGFCALLERTNPAERRAIRPSWIHFRAQDVRNPLLERPLNWFKSPLGHWMLSVVKDFWRRGRHHPVSSLG